MCVENSCSTRGIIIIVITSYSIHYTKLYEGKFKGRKEVEIKDFDIHYKRYMNREVTKAQLALQSYNFV